ncbi:MAG: MoaD/ThiS family protein [Proteobacteria bacterium]|nr:MoaD/ThiS family protein [Pseudomonadota bacterium]
MEIEIRLFATFREYLPKGSGSFSCKKILQGETTVGEIIRELKLPDNIPKIIIIRGNHVKEDYVVKDGDLVSIFPPIGGG